MTRGLSHNSPVGQTAAPDLGVIGDMRLQQVRPRRRRRVHESKKRAHLYTASFCSH